MVERCVRDAEVVGSNPTSPIFPASIATTKQIVRAVAAATGPGFLSRQPDFQSLRKHVRWEEAREDCETWELWEFAAGELVSCHSAAAAGARRPDGEPPRARGPGLFGSVSRIGLG